MNVRPLDPADLTVVAQVHADCFARQRESLAWVTSTSNAYPRFRYFVAESDGAIVGYIVWGEKSGFRDEVVLELEQLAVQSAFRSQGIGRALIRASLLNVQMTLQQRASRVKAVLVTTRADNDAQRLYRDVLGAEVHATIANLYSADEVIMIAQNPVGKVIAAAP